MSRSSAYSASSSKAALGYQFDGGDDNRSNGPRNGDGGNSGGAGADNGQDGGAQIKKNTGRESITWSNIFP